MTPEQCIRELLYQIASDNGMKYSEAFGKSEDGLDIFRAKMERKGGLVLYDKTIIPMSETIEQEAHRIRLRVLYMITTAGLIKLEEDVTEYYKNHPEAIK
jgi:hypothetical protein